MLLFIFFYSCALVIIFLKVMIKYDQCTCIGQKWFVCVTITFLDFVKLTLFHMQQI
jgi:hypothetical protein